MSESQAVLVRIPPSGLDDLAAIAVHADKLSDIAALIAESNIQLPSDEINKQIGNKTGLPEIVVGDLLDGLAILRSLMERLGLEVEDVVSSIDSSIQVQATEGWRQQYQDKWKNARDQIVRALKALPTESSLSVQQKARELTYAHQNVLTDASLITDLRPVYNAAGDKIHAIVLTHVLSVSYQDATGQQRIEFALDAADVAKLFKTVERAQIKTSTARKTLTGEGWVLMVPGAPDPSEEMKK